MTLLTHLRTPNLPPPWLDAHITEEAMNHLWDMINQSGPHKAGSVLQRQTSYGGPNNKVYEIEDKNDWFYENVLKECAERLHYKDWNNYYNVHIGHNVPPPVFEVRDMWVNHQKQHEYIPPHGHDGLFSFVVFMKIPTHWKEQQELPWLKNVKDSHVSDFQFLFGSNNHVVETFNMSLSPEDEGRILFFPAWLEHQVFPFYECEEERITVSGNIIPPYTIEEKERQFNRMKKELDEFEEHIKKEKKSHEQLQKENDRSKKWNQQQS